MEIQQMSHTSGSSQRWEKSQMWHFEKAQIQGNQERLLTTPQPTIIMAWFPFFVEWWEWWAKMAK